MNALINTIQTIIHDAIREHLPEISFSELEEDGKVYYMNGKNGTEYDWFVNEHLPSFMVFYNDRQNLGAVKATVYTDGGIKLYLYDDHGRNLAKEADAFLDAGEDEMLRLAVCLRINADDKRIWDASPDKIDTDALPGEEEIAGFLSNRQYYEPSIRRRELIGKYCVVSKKVTRDGFKVGFMLRDEPNDEQDSGWQFFAGDEDEEYTDKVENVELCIVSSIAGIDPAIIKYIDNPAGSRFVRKSSAEFEEDRNQPAFMEKWKGDQQ